MCANDQRMLFEKLVICGLIENQNRAQAESRAETVDQAAQSSGPVDSSH